MTKYSIEEIIGKKYHNNMPAYEKILTEKEIITVLSFIKSSWPSQIQEIQKYKFKKQIKLRRQVC